MTNDIKQKVDRSTNTKYYLIPYAGEGEEFDNLKDARKAYKEEKESHGCCTLVKINIETTTITTTEKISSC